MKLEKFGVLHGIKVLDLTRMLAGPFCTMMLADQGANVVKVESPEGDPTRYAGPFVEDDNDKQLGGFFQSVNRNKNSIIINLKKAEGKELFKTLVRSADVVVENFRPGVMNDMGLSFSVLKQVNPKIVMASISGFGDPRNGASPYTQWPAFDPIAQAIGGINGITGLGDDEPMRVGASVGDILPGMYMAFGILAALNYVNRTGIAQHVDVAMADSVLSICQSAVYQYSYSGIIETPAGNHHPLAAPAGIFKVKDGWVSVAALLDSHWTIFCQVLDITQLMTDCRFEDALKRRANFEELEKTLSHYLKNYTKTQLKQLLGGKIPIAPVQNMQDIFEDPHFMLREMLVEVDEPGTNQRKTLAGVPVKFSETPGGVKKRAPLLGENTVTVLQAAGFEKQKITQLMEKNIVA